MGNQSEVGKKGLLENNQNFNNMQKFDRNLCSTDITPSKGETRVPFGDVSNSQPKRAGFVKFDPRSPTAGVYRTPYSTNCEKGGKNEEIEFDCSDQVVQTRANFFSPHKRLSKEFEHTFGNDMFEWE